MQRRGRSSGFWFDASAVAAALVIHFATPRPAWVEAHYSNAMYPAVDRAVRALTGPLPFCLGDILAIAASIGLLGWWVVSLRAAPAGGRLTRTLRMALRTVALAAAAFVWFETSWALNYARVPLADKIPLHDERTNEAAVTAFADRVASELSRYAGPAHAEWAAGALSDAMVADRVASRFAKVIGRLGDRTSFSAPTVKPTIFQSFMEASGGTGFTDPWTHEVNVDASLFFFERPSVYVHEWSHIAGFADESEANLISVLACTTSSDPLLRYSGWMLTWFNLPSSIHVHHRLSRQAAADVSAIVARYRRHVKPAVERAQRVAYDRYLKANRQSAGFASYRLFVRWLTGADYDREGLPVVRSQSALLR